jgi:hypothetical protein
MFGPKLNHRCTVVKIGTGLAVGQGPSVFLHTKLVEEHLCFVRHVRLEQNASDAQSFGSKVDCPVNILSGLAWGEVKYVVPWFRHLEKGVGLSNVSCRLLQLNDGITHASYKVGQLMQSFARIIYIEHAIDFGCNRTQ